jgi:two-component system LytT family response regulator
MNLLIVDDEPAARTGLIRLCERAPDMHVVGEAGTGAKAIEAVESLRPDLMLLDADLPDMSGFDVLRALRRRHKRRTILITTNAQDAPGAFAAGAIDYLVKPVNEAAFSASILRARARAQARSTPRPGDARRLHAAAVTAAPCESDTGRPFLLVGEREHRLYPLDPYQIDYVESAGNYVTYHLSGVEYIARESIKRLDGVLAPAGFVRIQRSLLLNIRAIAYAQPIGHGTFAFTLVSGARLHSGDAYRDTILAALPLRRRAPPRPGRAPEMSVSATAIGYRVVIGGA